MDLKTLLGVELPIIQAPMAGVQGSALTVAVSNAGGLGSLPCAMLSEASIEQELQTIQAGTDKPFNVNFFCHTTPTIDDDTLVRWQSQLGGYYEELAVEPSSLPSGPARQPFNDAMANIVSRYKPAVVSFHFGLPSEALMRKVQQSGAKVIASATTVDEALWLEARGVDAIIAQGVEAGGHRGMFLSDEIATQVGTFALLPQVVQAVSVPVIAAGGIADARGVQAAMALGASGVQVGTAYLLCTEATTSQVHRAALQSDQASKTALTNLFSGRPARSIVNRLMKEQGPINQQTPPFPLATAAVAPLRAKAESLGSSDFSPLWAGQNVTGCSTVSASELTLQLTSIIEL